MRFKKIIASALTAVMLGTMAVTPTSATVINAEQSGASYFNAADKYAPYRGDDLGANYTPSATTFKVWAPVASDVKLNLYTTGSDMEAYAEKTSVENMVKDPATNVWSVTVDRDLFGSYYTYIITNNGKTTETQDIYSVATGVNGNRSMVIDLNTTNPDNWENDEHVFVDKQTDAVIWEVHMRDFSISESSGVRPEYRGKYLAFTQSGTKINGSEDLSTCIDYLVEQGVNYVHLNPVYDFGSVDETKPDKAQYNWGYDPVNYNVPEGSYSTNPYDGAVRIKEFKQMVQALHNNGIGVVMDVVYNHTYSTADSCFEKTVPGYYYRMDSKTEFLNGSGCGNVTASDKTMFRKYMIDSVRYWAEEYHIDGFRFDLMGCHDITTMNEIRASLDEIDPRILMYGEPWMADWSSNGLDYSEACVMDNASKVDSRVAMFSDKMRNTLKGGTDDASKGYIQGSTTVTHDLKAGMMGGSSSTFGKWAQAPSQCVTYNSAHDNLSLWDKIIISNGSNDFDSTHDMFIAQNKLSATIVLTSQGIPFYMAGEEFARTKQGDHNSYKSPDSINAIDWTRVKTYNNLVQYYKGLMQIRKAYSPFRASDMSAINTTYFVENGSTLGYTIRNTSSNASKEWGTMAVLVNNSTVTKALSLKMNGGTIPSEWVIVANGDKAGLEKLGTISGTSISVPARSALILVDASTYDRYKAKEPVYHTVTVNHINANTDTISATSVIKVREGYKYSTYPDLSIFDKPYKVIETEGVTAGTMGTEDITINYYYMRNFNSGLKVTTKYLLNDGTQLLEPEVQTTTQYKPYVTHPKVIAGYQLDTTKLPSNASGMAPYKDITVTYVYKPDDNNSAKTKIHYYNSNDWSNITMYAYDDRSGSTKYLSGVWPGNAMTAEGNGWFTYPELDSDYAQVIFTNGAGIQVPAAHQSGYEVGGEVWIRDGVTQFNSKVVVSHIDVDGVKRADDVIIEGNLVTASDTYTSTPLTELGEPQYSLGATTGKWSNSTINVVYVYDPLMKPTEPPTGVGMKDVLVGDANEDKEVSIVDVVRMQKQIISSEIPTTIQLGIMDANNSGDITVSDVIYAMKYIVGDSNCADVGKIRRIHFTIYL
ncbi:MAG: type I pullulanase [Acutalibacteraceae bacterium]|nr:type I pullulanase [Acutalibacteraceae bacterium]